MLIRFDFMATAARSQVNAERCRCVEFSLDVHGDGAGGHSLLL